jgi:hypothetical protein
MVTSLSTWDCLDKLPSPGAQPPFKGTHNITGDPPTIEISSLGYHGFIIDVTSVHQVGKETVMVLYCLEVRGWGKILPGPLEDGVVANMDV